MDYRLDKQGLLEILGQWNHFLRRKVHLVACGGTATTCVECLREEGLYDE